MTKINIDNKSYYNHFNPEVKDEVTRKRLQDIINLGLKEIGNGEFGIPGKMSGLYIENIWNYKKEYWEEYIKWIKTVK